MSKNLGCRRALMIEKLQQMNFMGPVEMGGHDFMVYHGRALAIPRRETFSIPQFRFMLAEMESLISQEEWHH